MTPTSDERREVARKIREYVDAYGDKIEDAEMVLLGTVWCRGEFNEVVKPTSEAELLAMVADLIDPTCHMVDTDHEYEDSIRCDVRAVRHPQEDPHGGAPRPHAGELRKGEPDGDVRPVPPEVRREAARGDEEEAQDGSD